MECIVPGAIRDEELFAYLAGEQVRPVVVEHLSLCRSCSAKLATYRELEQVLTGKLYRLDCPPNQVLGEYQLGMLNKDMTAAVRHHLSMCPLCTAEVAALTGFLAHDPVLEARTVPARVSTSSPARQNNHGSAGLDHSLERLRERAGETAQRIVAALITPQPRVSFARDGIKESAWPRTYAAQDFNISLQLEQDARRRDRLQLIGLIRRKGQALGDLEGSQARLTASLDAAMPEQNEYVDELGNFVFSAITPSTYTLELQLSEAVVVIDQLPIDPRL